MCPKPKFQADAVIADQLLKKKILIAMTSAINMTIIIGDKFIAAKECSKYV